MGGHLTMSAQAALLTALVAAMGCGARTGLAIDEPEEDAAPPADADDAGPADTDPEIEADVEEDADEDIDEGCVPVDDLCRSRESCGDGDDDDCDGQADEGCFCVPGEVQSCFAGPPGRRGVGACADGEQVCELSGTWGPCEGGILPSPDLCNGLDNLCNGCSAQEDCEIDCPGPDDPRVPLGTPLTQYALRGRDFYPGLVESWRWQVEGGLCDQIAPRFQSFELSEARRETATLFPRLSGDYRVSLTVVTAAGTRLSCEWLVQVTGPGLRVEMCYPESESEDLDLFVKQPGHETPWYPEGGTAWDAFEDACGWLNCEAQIRGDLGRADWGYEDSDLSQCIGGPQGDQWAALGFCSNPRLDIDNNLDEGTGLPENINIDAPREGERFRVMIQNFTGGYTEPLVNIYCAGQRIATFGAPPDQVTRFQGDRGNEAVGAMWRVADVTTSVDAAGELSCAVEAVHPPGSDEGYDVTYNDPRY